jgi:hypothetical protein
MMLCGEVAFAENSGDPAVAVPPTPPSPVLPELPPGVPVCVVKMHAIMSRSTNESIMTLFFRIPHLLVVERI